MNAHASTRIPHFTTRCGRAWSAKGPDSEPPIDLDTMLDLTAQRVGRRRQVRRRRSVSVRSARQHRLDRRRAEAARRPDPRATALVVGSLVAPVWPPTGGGSAMGDDDERQQFVDAGPEGLRDRQEAARHRHPHVRRRPDRLRREPGGVGEGSRTATRRRSPRPSARRATSPKSSASGSPPKARSAGAACTAGSGIVELLELVDRPKTLGFQADMAHTLLFTLGYNAPEDRLLPEDFDWTSADALDEALQDDDATRCGRGRSISTSRRTTRPSRDPARTTRPAVTACRTIRTASWTSPATPASGCATTTAQPTRAFQHICWDGCMFPNADDDAAATPGTTCWRR